MTCSNRQHRRLTLAATAIAAALALPLAGNAQTSGAPAAGSVQTTDAPRGGVHFSAGLGSGSMSVTCPGCETNFFEDRLNGLSGVLQLGGFVNPQLAITAEFMGWVKNDDPVFRRVASLGISLLGYPDAEGGFFVKGSLGAIRAIGEDDAILVQTDAWMATTGIGYDIPVGEKVNATLYANYIRAFGAGTWVNGFSSPIVATPNLIQFGLGLSVH